MASDPANTEALLAGSGLIWSFGALDFAGGTVVHINSGIAALVGALILGKRKSYKSEPIRPHNLTFTLIGSYQRLPDGPEQGVDVWSTGLLVGVTALSDAGAPSDALNATTRCPR